MRWPAVSASAWKLALCVFALCTSAFWLSEVWHSPRTLAANAAGTLGIRYHELQQWGRARYIIDEIQSDSPLRGLGAEAGDVWIPDRPYDAVRRLQAREPIGLTLERDDTIRHVVAYTLPDPTQTDPWLYVTGWSISLVGLVLGLVIGFRQPEGTAFRALASFMLLMGAFKAIPTYLILPAGPVFGTHHLLWGPGYMSVGALLLVFLFNFPDSQPDNSAPKRWLLKHVVPAVASLLFVLGTAYVVRALGYHVPLFKVIAISAALVFVVTAVAVMWSNWRSSSGDLRERHLWILLAFSAVSVVPPAVAALQSSFIHPQSASSAWWFARSVALVFLLTFTYAALRHRTVSIGFVLNRAMVFGAASIGMLLSFGLIEWMAHHLLDFAGREKSVWLDAGIALGIFLLFHRLRHWGERQIERLFFHAWHVKEEALRKFVKEAPFINQPAALLQAFAAALDRFTDGAGHALYRRTAGGDYERVAATLAGAPVSVDQDEPLLVSRRAAQAPSHCSDAHSALPGDLALPSIHHGHLDGFVLLGAKPNGETYRPDEQEVLGFAAHQVGLDFRALRMEQLEREVAELHARNADLSAALQQAAPAAQPSAS